MLFYFETFCGLNDTYLFKLNQLWGCEVAHSCALTSLSMSAENLRDKDPLVYCLYRDFYTNKRKTKKSLHILFPYLGSQLFLYSLWWATVVS